MSSKQLLLTILSSLLLAASCGGKKDDKMAKLCDEASEMLASQSQSASPDTMQLMLGNALEACGGGCDDGFEASCKKLESHLERLCGIQASMCVNLCEKTKGSVKKTACKIAEKAAKTSP